MRTLARISKRGQSTEERAARARNETADLRAQLAAVSGVSWRGALDDFESGMEAEKPKEEWSAIQGTKIALQWKFMFLHLWE